MTEERKKERLREEIKVLIVQKKELDNNLDKLSKELYYLENGEMSPFSCKKTLRMLGYG